MPDKKEVANQKVFVKLNDVVHLQNEINRIGSTAAGLNIAYVNGMIQACKLLGLPIDYTLPKKKAA